MSATAVPEGATARLCAGMRPGDIAQSHEIKMVILLQQWQACVTVHLPYASWLKHLAKQAHHRSRGDADRP